MSSQFKEGDKVFFKPMGEGVIFSINPSVPYVYHVIFRKKTRRGVRRKSANLRHVFPESLFWEKKEDISVRNMNGFYTKNPDYFFVN